MNRAAVRCSTVSVGYNLAVTLFGGTAPLAATVLVKITGWQAAPGLYLAATALVGLALLRYVPGRGRTDDGGCTNPPYELSSG
jgi:MHS family proline/betaine transporter-like MFS transporter